MQGLRWWVLWQFYGSVLRALYVALGCDCAATAVPVDVDRLSGACVAGTGGASCSKCLPGTYSKGGDYDDPLAPCKPCGLHQTSPPGAVSAEFCECEAGYGADRVDVPMDERQCVPCGFGTFNPGVVSSAEGVQGTMVSVAAADLAGLRSRIAGSPQILACQLCSSRNPNGGFTTLDIGSKSSQQCVCKPGFAGFDCAACGEVSGMNAPEQTKNKTTCVDL